VREQLLQCSAAPGLAHGPIVVELVFDIYRRTPEGLIEHESFVAARGSAWKR